MKIKARKIEHKTPKCFGYYSRIIDEDSNPNTTGGRSIGSKQIWPEEYNAGRAECRSRAEKLNAAELNDLKHECSTL